MSDLNIGDVRVEFNQDADTCAPVHASEVQSLTVMGIVSALPDDGHYWVIETVRWAFDDVEELTALLEIVIAGVETMKKKKKSACKARSETDTV